MTDLLTFVDGHRGGGIIDLGADTYDLDGTARGVANTWHANYPVHCSGATIRQAPTADRNASIVEMRGTDLEWSGFGHLVGARPEGTPFTAACEAQHGFLVAGAQRVKVGAGFTVSNVFGDGVYVSKDPHGRWASWVDFQGLTLDQIGRQAITVAAGIIVNVVARVNYANRSVLDIEPPGSDWGAEFVTADLDVYSPNGAVLANKGAGSGNVHDISVHAETHMRQWSATVLPPVGTRRSNFTLTGRAHGSQSHSTPIRLHRVDGVHVDVQQNVDRGVSPVLYDNCTGIA